MRLICPNCGAQYEVSDDVIPKQGRDVQCSNCGHTWFELPGASVAAEEVALADDVLGAGETEPQAADVTPPPVPAPEPLQEMPNVADDVPVAEPDPEPEFEPEPEPEPEPESAPAPEEPPAPKRQPLDQSIADILKEEAAREEANRAAEAQSGLESQGDLGIDDMPTMTAAKKAESQERIARIKGEEPEDANAAAIAEMVAGSRRELLPDIDDINATLRSDSERDTPSAQTEEEEAQERRGFRFGFFSVLLIFAVLVAIYVFADQIAAAVPALTGVLDAYVSAVDSLRIWFDVQMEKLLVRLEGSDA